VLGALGRDGALGVVAVVTGVLTVALGRVGVVTDGTVGTVTVGVGGRSIATAAPTPKPRHASAAAVAAGTAFFVDRRMRCTIPLVAERNSRRNGCGRVRPRVPQPSV
jgi:hypothetical protein